MQDFPSHFLAAYGLSMSLQRSHLEAGRCLPASLDAELAPGHLLATCLEGQRLAQAPPSSSSETAGEPMHNRALIETLSVVLHIAMNTFKWLMLQQSFK